MLQSTTTIGVVHLYQAQKSVTLTGTPSSSDRGRLVYLKNSDEDRQSLSFSLVPDTNVTINSNGLSLAPIYSRYCVTLLENPAYTYSLVNLYTDTLSGNITPNASPPIGTTIVNVSGSNPYLLVDLQTESKVLVLPQIETITSLSSQSAYFAVKDVYNQASIRALYLSTSGNRDSFENLGNLLQLNVDGQACEIACEREFGRWYILSAL